MQFIISIKSYYSGNFDKTYVCKWRIIPTHYLVNANKVFLVRKKSSTRKKSDYIDNAITMTGVLSLA